MKLIFVSEWDGSGPDHEAKLLALRVFGLAIIIRRKRRA